MAWGIEECPEGRRELYRGVTTYGATQGGYTTRYSCFPNRVEYHPLPLTGAQINKVFQDDNLPCLRCLASNASRVVTIPGTFLCPEGWMLEYSGFLATDAAADMRAGYVCLYSSDGMSQSQRSVRGLLDGAAVYDKEKDLTCAVCTT